MSRQRFSTLHSALPRDFADRPSTSAGRKIAHSDCMQQPAPHPPNPPARMPARSHRFARILGLFLTCLLVSSASPTGTLTPLARSSTCTPTNTTTLLHTDRLGPAAYKTQLRPSRPKAAYSDHGTSHPSYSPLYPTSLPSLHEFVRNALVEPVVIEVEPVPAPLVHCAPAPCD